MKQRRAARRGGEEQEAAGGADWQPLYAITGAGSFCVLLAPIVVEVAHAAGVPPRSLGYRLDDIRFVLLEN